MQKQWKFFFLHRLLPTLGVVLQISGVGYDRMGENLKPKKIPKASNEPPPPQKKKSLDQKLTPQKTPCQFPSLKIFQKAKQVLLYLIRRTRQRGYTSTIVNPHKEMANVQRATMELRTHAGGC